MKLTIIIIIIIIIIITITIMGFYSHFFLVEKASYQSLSSKCVCPANSNQDGDSLFSSDEVHQGGWLHGLNRFEWHILPSVYPAREPPTTSRFYISVFPQLLKHSPESLWKSHLVCITSEFPYYTIWMTGWSCLQGSVSQDFDKLLSLCQELGIIVKWEKSKLVPR